MAPISFDVDPVHTFLGFSVRHLAIPKVHGRFTRFRGLLEIDWDDLLRSRIGLRHRRRWEGELVQTTQDGRTVIASAKLQLIRHDDGVERVLEVNRDITDRKRAEDALRDSEQQLREADRRKDEFLAVLSHELRNPLAPIRNRLYVLDRAPPGGEQARHAREVIERQISQLTRLVSDLLDVSRITRGKVQIQGERLDLREVVHRTIEDHRSMYAALGLQLRADLPGREVWVDGDPARLAQLLTNLLHNAAKFTLEGGTVTVTLRLERGTATLQVRDTGAGIPPDLLEHVFEPFMQGAQPLARASGGFGLGLALVKGIVELHGGSVAAHSDGLGCGAIFTVRVPAEAHPVRAPPPTEAPRHVPALEDPAARAPPPPGGARTDRHRARRHQPRRSRHRCHRGGCAGDPVARRPKGEVPPARDRRARRRWAPLPALRLSLGAGTGRVAPIRPSTPGPMRSGPRPRAN